MDFIDDKFLGELTCWLNKSGELTFESELRKIASSWSEAQKIRLYEFLRDNGERSEAEWRPQFVGLIGISEESLPDRKNAEVEDWGKKIFELIDEGDLRKLQAFVEETGQLAQRFDPDVAYEEGKLCNKGVAEIVPFEFYPLETANEEAEYPEPYARKRGKVDIADFLKASIDYLSRQWKVAYEEGYRREMAKRRTFRIEVHNDLTLSHNGVTGPLGELVSKAVSEQANFLIMQISRSSKASSAEAWLPIQGAFQKAGITEFENDWQD